MAAPRTLKETKALYKHCIGLWVTQQRKPETQIERKHYRDPYEFLRVLKGSVHMWVEEEDEEFSGVLKVWISQIHVSKQTKGLILHPPFLNLRAEFSSHTTLWTEPCRVWTVLAKTVAIEMKWVFCDSWQIRLHLTNCELHPLCQVCFHCFPPRTKRAPITPQGWETHVWTFSSYLESSWDMQGMEETIGRLFLCLSH